MIADVPNYGCSQFIGREERLKPIREIFLIMVGEQMLWKKPRKRALVAPLGSFVAETLL